MIACSALRTLVTCKSVRQTMKSYRGLSASTSRSLTGRKNCIGISCTSRSASHTTHWQSSRLRSIVTGAHMMAALAMSWWPLAPNMLVSCTSLRHASIGSMCAAEANACLVRLTVRLHAGNCDVTLSDLCGAEFDGEGDLAGVEHVCYGPDDLLKLRARHKIDDLLSPVRMPLNIVTLPALSDNSAAEPQLRARLAPRP
jgi:hypothetical protein